MPYLHFEASFTARISKWRSGRLLCTTTRLSFQIRAITTNFSDSLAIYAARAEESPSALLLSLSLPIRCRRSAFVALYGFVYGSVDKAVYALAAGFCVGLDNIFLAFRHSNGHAIKIRSIPFSIALFTGLRIFLRRYMYHSLLINFIILPLQALNK